MGTINKTVKTNKCNRTHEGASVVDPGALEQLKRTVMTCMLWEDGFYVDGQSHAEIIKSLVRQLLSEGKAQDVYEVAFKAKHEQHLRHVPLFIARLMVKDHAIKADQINSLINRVDDITEFMAMYWADGGSEVTPVAKAVRVALRKSFQKFTPYQIAKYQKKDATVKLRDCLRILRVKPINAEMEQVFKELREKKLKAPDTWEANLSKGADKAETFERLMSDGKLGALATLRNLRNMKESGVNSNLLRQYIAGMNVEKILPFHFIKAYEHAPEYVSELNTAMMKALEGSRDQLKGKTLVLLDKSGSMHCQLSGKSELLRSDVAKGLAILLGEVCEDIRLFQFDSNCVLVKGNCENGLGLLKSLARPSGGTDIEEAVRYAVNHEKGEYDRIIILTDEQSQYDLSGIGANKKMYILNVGEYENGVGYQFGCHHINGWSDKVIDYIIQLES